MNTLTHAYFSPQTLTIFHDAAVPARLVGIATGVLDLVSKTLTTNVAKEEVSQVNKMIL